MQQFFVRFQKEAYSASTTFLAEDVLLTPLTWRATDRGGPDYADIVASGTVEGLASLSGWLGDRVEIYNSLGTLVWWGVLWDIELSIDRMLLTWSLDNVYNRVAVIYPHINADGSEESRTTAWAEDTQSLAHYGKRELLYSKPAQFTNAAEDVRDAILARLKTAQASISTQGESRFEARLACRGLWHKTNSVYFTNLDGLVEHRDESGSTYLGVHITSTLISFGTSNPGGEADEMWYGTGTEGDFDPLVVGDTFTVTGSTSNDGTYTIENMDANYQIAISGTFTAEAAGATVKISWGSGESQTNIAQSFTPDTTWVCTHVAVKVRRVGSPSDSFRIGIYPDSTGVPGTVLTANETLGSALFSELTWTEFAFATPVTLTGGTTYWLNMRRTGSASLDDGYEVALDEGLGYAGEVLKVYNGSTWVARDPDADMPFRIIGEISSTEQISIALALMDDVPNALVQVDSEIPIRQYSDDERTVSEELEEMLDAGTSTGARLVAHVLPDNSVVVTTVPENDFSSPNLVLGMDGKLSYPNRTEYPPGMLVFGRYVDVDSLVMLDSLSINGSRSSSVYVAESTYDATTGRLAIADDGAVDPFKALTVKKA